MKVGILLENQKVTDKPRDFVSKSGAESLCRRLTHRRISKFLIQAIAVREWPATLPRIQREIPAYIPENMPSPEVPGVVFKNRWNPDVNVPRLERLNPQHVAWNMENLEWPLDLVRNS